MCADRSPSRTAVLVCQGRAAAHGIVAPGRFADPTAMALLRPGERNTAQRVRDGSVPQQWPQRVDYETVRAGAAAMAARTVAIDDAVRAHPVAQLVILGAGLDGRAWRMTELTGTTFFEVDQPASQQDKRARAAELSGTAPRYVPVDFGRDPLARSLAGAGHRPQQPTTWIWEGVVPYLTPAQVTATLTEVAACSAPGSRLIVNFQIRSAYAAAGRLLARLMTASTGRRSIWAKEPWRSTWTSASMSSLLSRHGFAVTGDTDLLEVARELSITSQRSRSLTHSRIMVADRPEVD
jgi:methyltransferase (TIGR00027 family)